MRHFRILLLLSLLAVLALGAAPARASTDLLIRLPIGGMAPEVNGQAVAIDVPAQIRDGRTLVPLRFVSEHMGASVVYHAADQRITITLGAGTVEVWVNRIQARINGAAAVLDVPPVIVDNRTLVPLRFISENLGAEVAWDAAAREAFVVLGSPASLVRIQNFAFEPEALTVRAGSRVVVINFDGASHTWSNDRNAFDSGRLSGGAAYSTVLRNAGTYAAVCELHPNMTQSVRVEP